MDGTILYKSIRIDENIPTYIDYYIVPESISAAYCDLKCYGVKIEKTLLLGGGGKIIETKQINNVFYRENDVYEFISEASEEKIEPRTLPLYMEKYITESLRRAKDKI